MILPGSPSQSLATELAAETGEELAEVDLERFPDGEFKVRVPPDIDRAVVVIATLSSHAHLELLQLQDAAREAGAAEVITVLPYMGYARQDRAFNQGEPVSARAIARAISTGTDRVFLVNPHEDVIANRFDVPTTVIDAVGVLAEPLPADLLDPLFLAPDESAVRLAGAVRDAHGTGETDYLEKTRDRDTGEVYTRPSDTVSTDRDVVLVDDIVATGRTMSAAIDRLEGPASVTVACVHPVLAGNARSLLARSGVDDVYGTDTVERAVSAVSAAPAITPKL